MDRRAGVVDNKETMKVENKNTDTNIGNTTGKPDTIQVDPIMVAEATIAFMNVDNANLNLVNKKLMAENKILEIMGLAGVSPREYGYNPNTGVLERQKQKEPVVPEPVKPVEPVPAPIAAPVAAPAPATAATANDTSS